jgi:hypothetical protein
MNLKKYGYILSVEDHSKERWEKPMRENGMIVGHEVVHHTKSKKLYTLGYDSIAWGFLPETITLNLSVVEKILREDAKRCG